MAYSKSAKFSENEQELAILFKALSHPARISILKILSKYNASFCGEIVAELPLSQSTVSQHLKELRSAGLLKTKQDGPAVRYSINKANFAKAQKLINKFFKKANNKLDI